MRKKTPSKASILLINSELQRKFRLTFETKCSIFMEISNKKMSFLDTFYVSCFTTPPSNEWSFFMVQLCILLEFIKIQHL